MSGYLVVDGMDVLIFVCLEVTSDGGWCNALHSKAELFADVLKRVLPTIKT